MTRALRKVLVIADEPAGVPAPPALREIAPDVVLSCGDLPFDLLERVADTCNAPLVYVPGNHDPEIVETPLPFSLPPFVLSGGDKPRAGINLDGRAADVAGIRVAGLGGSVRYRRGPNQYTQRQMRLRSLRLEAAERVRRRRPEILLTHAPPLDVGDDDDPAHRGFAAFHRLIRVLEPRYHVHGHIHLFGRRRVEHRLGKTTVVNAVGHRVLTLEVDR